MTSGQWFCWWIAAALLLADSPSFAQVMPSSSVSARTNEALSRRTSASSAGKTISQVNGGVERGGAAKDRTGTLVEKSNDTVIVEFSHFS